MPVPLRTIIMVSARCALHSCSLLLFSSGFCRLIPHPRSPGTWTIYFEGADYESHVMRENTELASIVREMDGWERRPWSTVFENRLQICSLLAVNIAVIRRF